MTEIEQSWEILFEPRLEKLLKQLSKDLIRPISQTILALAQNPDPPECKPRPGQQNLYHLDVASWRIVYAVEAVLENVNKMGYPDLFVPLLSSATDLLTKLRDPTLGEVIHLGCYDFDRGNDLPEIDLRPDGGLENDVSWRQARLFKQGAEIFIEATPYRHWGRRNPDKEYITTVNGNQLASFTPQLLYDGDQLQLGQLPIEISITRSET